MAASKVIEISLLRKLMTFDPDTGKLFWCERSVDMFSQQRDADAWNARYADKEAFTATGSGYRTGGLFGGKFQAHRVAWAIHFGSWPTNQIDHINGDRSDNRIVNLRDVTHQENGRNQKVRPNTSSGIVGVSMRHGKWRATIRGHGKNLILGTFDTVGDAVAARKSAEANLGYHENHGKTQPIS